MPTQTSGTPVPMKSPERNSPAVAPSAPNCPDAITLSHVTAMPLADWLLTASSMMGPAINPTASLEGHRSFIQQTTDSCTTVAARQLSALELAHARDIRRISLCCAAPALVHPPHSPANLIWRGRNRTDAIMGRCAGRAGSRRSANGITDGSEGKGFPGEHSESTARPSSASNRPLRSFLPYPPRPRLYPPHASPSLSIAPHRCPTNQQTDKFSKPPR